MIKGFCNHWDCSAWRSEEKASSPEEELFTSTRRGRTRGNCFNLKENMFRLDLRKKFLVKVVRHQNRLLREVVASPLPQCSRLDGMDGMEI